MALERTGLSAVLTFNEKSAVRSMGRASKSFNALKQASQNTGNTVVVDSRKLKRMSQTSKLLGGNLGKAARMMKFLGAAATKMGAVISRAGVAVTNFGRSLGFAALAFIPLTLAMKKGVEDAADFEQAMADAAAVNPRQTSGIKEVEKEVRRLGRSTKFTAVEVGRSFESMRRAGLDAERSIKLLKPATDLAAAGGLELAEATKVMTKTAVVFEKQGIKDADIVDKLALASTKSTANLQEMGIALGFTSGAAAALNIPLDQTLAGLAQVQTRTKEGSRAGTAFNAMITRLAEKTKKGKINIAGMTVAVRKNDKGQLDLLNTLNDINTALAKKFPDSTDRAGVASRFFGKRAGRAFNALVQDIGNFDKTIVELGDPTKFRNIAQEMKEMRLNTFSGQLTILKSAITDLDIEFFGDLKKSLVGPMKKVISFLNQVVEVMQDFKIIMNGTEGDALKALDAMDDVASIARTVGVGLAIAIEDIKGAFNSLKTTVKDFVQGSFKQLGIEGRVNAAMLVSFAAKAYIVLAILAPVIAFVSVLVIAFGTMLSSIGSIVSALAALKGVAVLLLGGALIPIIKVVAVIAAVLAVAALAFKAFQRDGESVTDAMVRLWETGIKPIIVGFVTAFAPTIQFIRNAIAALTPVLQSMLDSLVDAFRPIIDSIFVMNTGIGDIGTTFGSVFGFITRVLVTFLTMFAAGVAMIIKASAMIGGFLINNIVKIIKLITFNISEMITSFRMIFSGDILNGLFKLGEAMISNMITPFSQFIRLLFDAAEAVLGIKIPEGVRRFVEAPEFKVPQRGEQALAGAVQKGVEAAGPPTVEAKVDVTDKRTLDVTTCLNVDGEEIARTVAKHEKDILKRSGAGQTRWQNRMVAEQGAISVGRPQR